MPSRYFKLAFSTIGALGFGLVAAAVFLPQTFSGLFNPEAIQTAPVRTEAERQADRAAAAALSQSSETIDLPQNKDALDIMADSLKQAQDQQAAEATAALQAIKPDAAPQETAPQQ